MSQGIAQGVFGALVAELRLRVLVLHARALYDNDDEARPLSGLGLGSIS